MRGPGARPGTVLATAGLVAVATGVAAAAWWPVYAHPHFVVLVAATIALGAALAIAAVLLRWPAWVLLLAGFALFLLAGVPLAVPSRAVAGALPTLDGIVDLLAGVALGWKQLLTITLPVGDYQALLVPVYLLVLVSVVAGIRVGVLESGGSWAMLGPAVVFVAGLAFGSSEPLWPAPLALGLLVLALGWLVWRRARRRRAALRALGAPGSRTGSVAAAGSARSLVAAGAILAVAAAASLGATAALPPRTDRDVLRETVEQPFDPREYVSPLAGFRRYLLDPEEVQLRVTGLGAGERLRLATLDRYDGVVYAVGDAGDGSGSGTFVRVPSRLDRDGLGLPSRVLEVEVVGYRGVWLPTVGLLESVRFTGGDVAALAEGFAANPGTGSAAVVGGLGEGDGYRLTTVVPAPVGLEELVAATPGGSELPRVDALPSGLAALLDSWVGGVQAPGERLTTMVERLRATGYISHGLDEDEPPSRSGHGADRIGELVSADRMIGDAEQYAVTAALMARQLGFPARVVMGFAPSSRGAGETVEVRGADVSAWIEVDTAEHGWVAIDPVPPPRPIPDEDPEEATPISRPQSLVPPPADDPPDHEEQSAPESTRDEQTGVDPVLAALLAVARVAGVVLLVVAVLLAPFLLVIAAKLRRRRLRRRAATPLARIRGGWDDFADTALDHGIAPPPVATRSELAAAVGTLPARVLAAAVDRATFAPERAEEAEARRVWDAVDEIRAGFDLGATRWRRLRALVSIRSLGAAHARGWRSGKGTGS